MVLRTWWLTGPLMLPAGGSLHLLSFTDAASATHPDRRHFRSRQVHPGAADQRAAGPALRRDRLPVPRPRLDTAPGLRGKGRRVHRAALLGVRMAIHLCAPAAGRACRAAGVARLSRAARDVARDPPDHAALA